MATIRKNGARTVLATGTAFPGVRNWTSAQGLVFTLQIGLHNVTLTHYEKDMVLAKWAEMQKEHEA